MLAPLLFSIKLPRLDWPSFLLTIQKTMSLTYRSSATQHSSDSSDINNKKRSHTQLDSRKQVIAFQDRVITINIKEAQHPLK